MIQFEIFLIFLLTSVFGEKAKLLFIKSWFWFWGLRPPKDAGQVQSYVGNVGRMTAPAGPTQLGLSLLSEDRQPRQVSLVSTNHTWPGRMGRGLASGTAEHHLNLGGGGACYGADHSPVPVTEDLFKVPSSCSTFNSGQSNFIFTMVCPETQSLTLTPDPGRHQWQKNSL